MKLCFKQVINDYYMTACLDPFGLLTLIHMRSHPRTLSGPDPLRFAKACSALSSSLTFQEMEE